MQSAFILLISIVVLGLVILNAWHTQRKRREAWSAFAEQQGLTLDPQKLLITGRLDGRPFELSTYRRGSGNSRHDVTRVRISVEEVLPRGLSLEREGLGDKVLKLLGNQDEEIGHEKFDRFFKLEGLTPHAAEVFHHPEVQRRLFALARAYPYDFSITQGWFTASQRGVPTSAWELDNLVRPLLELGRTLESTARSV